MEDNNFIVLDGIMYSNKYEHCSIILNKNKIYSIIYDRNRKCNEKLNYLKIYFGDNSDGISQSEELYIEESEFLNCIQNLNK